MSGNTEQDRRLWERFGARTGPSGSPPPDANDLAAYLDGSADPQAIERVEARLADDPTLLDELIELRRLTSAEHEAAPRTLLAQAKGLLAAPAAKAKRSWWGQLQWVAAAAAVVIACWGGYSFGANAFDSQAKARVSTTSTLEELIGDNELTMPQAGQGQDGQRPQPRRPSENDRRETRPRRRPE